VWRESASSVAVSSPLTALLPVLIPCVCSPAAACARRRLITGWLGVCCWSWAVRSSGICEPRGRLLGSVRCIASAVLSVSGLGVAARADDAALGCLSALRTGLRELSGLAAWFVDSCGGHGAGRSTAFLLSRAAGGSCGSTACVTNPARCPPPLPRTASAAADGAAPTQLLSVSSARQARTQVGAVIAPGRAILLQGAEGVGGPHSEQPMPSIDACPILVLLNTPIT